MTGFQVAVPYVYEPCSRVCHYVIVTRVYLAVVDVHELRPNRETVCIMRGVVNIVRSRVLDGDTMSCRVGTRSVAADSDVRVRRVLNAEVAEQIPFALPETNQSTTGRRLAGIFHFIPPGRTLTVNDRGFATLAFDDDVRCTAFAGDERISHFVRAVIIGRERSYRKQLQCSTGAQMQHGLATHLKGTAQPFSRRDNYHAA